jgi:hypothetical protein
MFLQELLEYGGSSLFDISIDLHPTNRSQYLPVVKLPSQAMLPSLTQHTVSIILYRLRGQKNTDVKMLN